VSSASRFAQFFTDALAPAHLVAFTVLVIACSESGLLSGLGWAMLTLLFAPGLPFALILLGTRRGWWTDRHVRVREQRLWPLTFALASIILCLTVLFLAGAPRAIGALVIAMTAGLVVTLAVTTVWKISVHSAVAAGSAVCLSIQWGTLGAAMVFVAALAVAWSRIQLRAHTPAQVLAGAVLGAGVAAGLFATLSG
jgi:membrane-associated phospholipid phosphatase